MKQYKLTGYILPLQRYPSHVFPVFGCQSGQFLQLIKGDTVERFSKLPSNLCESVIAYPSELSIPKESEAIFGFAVNEDHVHISTRGELIQYLETHMDELKEHPFTYLSSLRFIGANDDLIFSQLSSIKKRLASVDPKIANVWHRTMSRLQREKAFTTQDDSRPVNIFNVNRMFSANINALKKIYESKISRLYSFAKLIELENHKISKIIFHQFEDGAMDKDCHAILITQELELMAMEGTHILTYEHYIFFQANNSSPLKTRLAVAHELSHIYLHHPSSMPVEHRYSAPVQGAENLFTVEFSPEQEIEALIFSLILVYNLCYTKEEGNVCDCPSFGIPSKAFLDLCKEEGCVQHDLLNNFDAAAPELLQYYKPKAVLDNDTLESIGRYMRVG